LIKEKYDFNSKEYEWKTATEIAAEIGLRNITQADTRAIVRALSTIYQDRTQMFKNTSYKRLIYVPSMTEK